MSTTVYWIDVEGAFWWSVNKEQIDREQRRFVTANEYCARGVASVPDKLLPADIVALLQEGRGNEANQDIIEDVTQYLEGTVFD